MQPIPEVSTDRKVPRSFGSAPELDRQLRRAEEAIQRRAWGVCASVVLRCGIDEEGGGEWQESLCFGKMDGRWCLHLQSGFNDVPSSLKQTELFAANLETRLLAAKKVPLLIEALLALQPSAVEDTSRVARELGAFVDRFLRSDC